MAKHQQSSGQPAPPAAVPGEFTTDAFTNIDRRPGGFEGDDAAQDAALKEFAGIEKRTTISRITAHEPVTIPKEGGPDSQRAG